MGHAFAEEITFAAAALGRGEIVAYPTETFYGLGVNALDELALARLKQLKGRGADKTTSVLVHGPEMIDRLCKKLPARAAALIERYWPGPLTIAVPARRGIPAALVWQGCVAIRQSPHPTAQALVRAFAAPVTATSANRSGEPPVTSAEAVEAIFEGRCRVLDGGITPGGAPSTLVRVRGNRIEVLRAGAVDIAPELVD